MCVLSVFSTATALLLVCVRAPSLSVRVPGCLMLLQGKRHLHPLLLLGGGSVAGAQEHSAFTGNVSRKHHCSPPFACLSLPIISPLSAPLSSCLPLSFFRHLWDFSTAVSLINHSQEKLVRMGKKRNAKGGSEQNQDDLFFDPVAFRMFALTSRTSDDDSLLLISIRFPGSFFETFPKNCFVKLLNGASIIK